MVAAQTAFECVGNGNGADESVEQGTGSVEVPPKTGTLDVRVQWGWLVCGLLLGSHEIRKWRFIPSIHNHAAGDQAPARSCLNAQM